MRVRLWEGLRGCMEDVDGAGRSGGAESSLQSGYSVTLLAGQANTT